MACSTTLATGATSKLFAPSWSGGLEVTGIRVMRVRVVRIGCKGTGATMNGTGRVSERGRGHERVAA